MNSITRALVALDFSKMDDHLLSYSQLVSGAMNLEKLYFVHIVPDFFVSNDFEFAAPVATPVDERIQNIIEEKVKKQFAVDSGDLDIAVNVIEGSPYERLLHWTELKKIDLLITGKKKKSEGSGITAKRVAHRVDCNILFVPENANPAPSKILVPIDFSDHSARALKSALHFKTLVPEVEIVAMNVVHYLPSDYYFGLDNNPVYREAVIDNSKKAYQKLLDKNGLTNEDIEVVFIENSRNNIARHINHYASKIDADLIIMGAKGHSAFENFIFGSVTERLVDYCDDVPILVVR